LHLSNFKLAWEFVIKEPLNQGSKVQNYEEDRKLSKIFILMQKCPISTFLNLYSIAEKCILLERPHMAAVLAAFAAKDSDREKIMSLISVYKKSDLMKNIEELEEFGLAPVISKSACLIVDSMLSNN
jgi:kinetochore-associated protein 1